MAHWFWFFLFYSFWGFCLEILFARVTHTAKQDRKCFYFLPLCPVYGLGALAILALPGFLSEHPFLLFLSGGAVATGAEYGMGLFYERVLGVRFWDYSHLPANLGGKVCLLFSAMWGLLSLGLVYLVHPTMERLAAALPQAWLVPAALFFTLDTLFTCFVLRRTRSTEALRWYLHLSPRTREQE